MKESQDVRDLLQSAYTAMQRGDSAALGRLISDDPSVLGIGTDPEEWWRGSVFAATWSKQIQELGSLQLVASEPVAFSSGDLGWAADRPKFRLPDGTEVEVRVSLVARREGSEWRIVHWHASIGISNVEAVGQELTTSA